MRRETNKNTDSRVEEIIESVSDPEDNENDSDTTLEISISVPNLSDIKTGYTVPVTTRHVVQLQRSISDTQVRKQLKTHIYSFIQM